MSNESKQEEITAGAIRQTREQLKQSAEKSLVEWREIREQAEGLNPFAIHNANHQISWLEGYLEGLRAMP